eukprot:14562444-Alexandrium_andersonii.AAC.1
MSASLVGSEMCIRDRCMPRPRPSHAHKRWAPRGGHQRQSGMSNNAASPVSYTHLTLPTICSV